GVQHDLPQLHTRRCAHEGKCELRRAAVTRSEKCRGRCAPLRGPGRGSPRDPRPRESMLGVSVPPWFERHQRVRRCSRILPFGSMRTTPVNGLTDRVGCSRPATPPANRTSLQRTVAIPCASIAVRAAGKREKPRKAWPSVVVAALVTAGVQTFG